MASDIKLNPHMKPFDSIFLTIMFNNCMVTSIVDPKKGSYIYYSLLNYNDDLY